MKDSKNMSIDSGFPEPQNTAMENGVESTKSKHMPKIGYKSVELLLNIGMPSIIIICKDITFLVV
jgi:hypothetical protein